MIGRPTLLGWSVAESCLTLWGVEISRLHSSADLTLVPWWTEQLDRLDDSFIAPVSNVTCEVLIVVDGQTFF